MSEQDKQQDLLRELEIESILEETHYLADQEKMEQTAQKYRAKPKMDEIFSNADKKPRLKNKNPLDEVDKTNTIVGEKTAATIMAIVSHESGIPLNRLDFKSIKLKEDLELYKTDDKTAAAIMAIVSNQTGIPLNKLAFKSIKLIEK